MDRAEILIEQGRYREAEKELGKELEKDPNDPYIYTRLAFVLIERGQLRKAEAAAKETIRLEPDSDLGFFALARVHLAANRPTSAKKAINEAIRLDPDCAVNHAVLARLEYEMGHWRRCLEAAETGLEIDPDEDTCQFYRGIALSHLARDEDADEQFDELLGNDPEDASNHAGLGWVLLGRGERLAAEKHFREALRINATHEDARDGLVTCLRARNPLFSWPYRLGLWFDRFGAVGLIVLLLLFIGIYEGISFIRVAYPEWSSFLGIPLVISMLMVTLSAVAFPFANVFLLFSRLGRQALKPIERKVAIISAPLVLLSIWLFVRWVMNGAERIPSFPMLVMWTLMPLHQVAQAERRRTRQIMWGYSALVILATLGPLTAFIVSFFLQSRELGIGSLLLMRKERFIVLACILADYLREWLDGRFDADDEEDIPI